MRKKALLALCLLQTMFYLYGQSDNNKSVIYFYRLPNFSGSAINIKISLNDIPVIRLRNNSFYKHEVTPGEYNISCKMPKSSGLKLYVEPGKTYYIKSYLNQGFWAAIPVLELVNDNTGIAAVEGSSLRKLAYKPLSMVRPKSRLGVTIGGGAGFENIIMGTNDLNEDLKLSTGGGFAIGAEYGKEISNSFDLSINMFFQTSQLSPPVRNANASFNRFAITATPALIIPIKSGDYFRFRLGAGPGFYGGSKMTISDSNSGGKNFDLKYKSTIGYHGSLVFDSNFSDRGSVSIGIKYYNINYKYTSKGSTGRSSDTKVNSPNGSGIDFLLGYYFLF
jgi:hypothetical protein